MDYVCVHAEIMSVKHLFDASHRFSGSYTAKKMTTSKSLMASQVINLVSRTLIKLMVLFVLPVDLTGLSLPDMTQWKCDFKI